MKNNGKQQQLLILISNAPGAVIRNKTVIDILVHFRTIEVLTPHPFQWSHSFCLIVISFISDQLRSYLHSPFIGLTPLPFSPLQLLSNLTLVCRKNGTGNSGRCKWRLEERIKRKRMEFEK